MKETKNQNILRGTTLFDATIYVTSARSHHTNAYLCNGRTRSSLLADAFSRLLGEEL